MADYDNKLCLITHPPNQVVVGINHQKYYEHLVLDANKVNKKSCMEICLTKQDLFRAKSLFVVTSLHSVVHLALYIIHFTITVQQSWDKPQPLAPSPFLVKTWDHNYHLSTFIALGLP